MKSMSWCSKTRPLSLLCLSSIAVLTCSLSLMLGSFSQGTYAETPSSPPALIIQTPPQLVDEHVADTLTVSFQQDFANVVNEARCYVQKHKSRKAAVVFDLDETLLDNRAYYVRYKTFTPEQWHTWVILSEAPGIVPTMDFVHWLNKKHVRVFFVSGRLESERDMTVANLNKIGITKYAGLYLRPNNYSSSSMKNFKVAAQEDIQKKGYRLLLLLGDQESDMKSAIGKGFKLPNPIYTVP